MIELFAITDLDSTLVIEAASSLLSARSYTALIKLVGIFGSIDWTLSDYVKAMTSSKDWSSAELLVKTLDQSSEKGALHRFQPTVSTCYPQQRGTLTSTNEIVWCVRLCSLGSTPR
jgi:hypothetical protein